jgi:hypothetical protein
MARYNTVIQTSTLVTGQSVGTPAQGLYTQFTGPGPFTVQLASPVTYLGSSQTFYNATSGSAGTVTLSTTTAGGYIQGPGQGATATSYGLVAGGICTVFSDGTNYQVVTVNGANTVVNTLTANSTVGLSPANNNVTISPTGTGNFIVNPAGTLTSNTIDNVTIGATTPGTGKFTTLTLNTTMDGAGTIDGGTY